jgi:hypothetical protein
MKKFLAVMLCALTMLSVFPMMASAAETAETAAAETAETVVKASDGGSGITDIFSQFGDLFTGSTDIAALFTSVGKLFTQFFGVFTEIIDWQSVGSSVWASLKKAFEDFSTTISFFFAGLYNK